MSIIGNSRLYCGGENPEYIVDGAVYFDGDEILDIGTTQKLIKKYPQAKFKDAENKLVMPGFVCAHGHFYGMFARGMALKDDPPKTFQEILERLWWRLDLALEKEDNYLSAMVCLVQAIKSGTTTIIDHHASPNAIAGSLDTVAEATTTAGVRACLCYEVTDRNGEEGALNGIKENARFIKKCYVDAPDPLLGATFGLHAAFTVSDETLRKCVEALNSIPNGPQLTGFHIHVAEGPTDAVYSLKNFGKRTLLRLNEAGILLPKSLCVHCVDVDSEEVDVVKKSGASIIHNPESNMNNAVGVSDVLGMLKDGICVGLGTDGMTLDMMQESKTNYLLHKLKKDDPRVMGGETLTMLGSNNAKIASQYFQKPVGELKIGSFADIIIVDYDPPTPLSAGNFPWHMQFGMSSDMVDTTIVGGKTLMENRKLLTLDVTDIMRRARARAPGVWERF